MCPEINECQITEKKTKHVNKLSISVGKKPNHESLKNKLIQIRVAQNRTKRETAFVPLFLAHTLFPEKRPTSVSTNTSPVSSGWEKILFRDFLPFFAKAFNDDLVIYVEQKSTSAGTPEKDPAIYDYNKD